jgi:hypothetical protein
MTGFAEEIAEVFTAAYPEQESQEGLRDDFADLGAEVTLSGFERTERILRGFMSAFETADFPLYIALSEAKARAREARAVAERYAGGSPSGS